MSRREKRVSKSALTQFDRLPAACIHVLNITFQIDTLGTDSFLNMANNSNHIYTGVIYLITIMAV